jgi:Carbohydrate esterase 2 N-terminal/GDSL-like Lipase/Acylhydrolase family
MRGDGFRLRGFAGRPVSSSVTPVFHRLLLASFAVAALAVAAVAGCSSTSNKPPSTGGSADAGDAAVGDASTSGLDSSPAVDGGAVSDADAAPVALDVLGVRWIGRVDPGDGSAVRFAWSGTGFVGTVSGTTINANMNSTGVSDPIYFQPVIDGDAGARIAVTGGAQTVTIASGLADGDHRVEFYRETEGNLGLSIFQGFEAGTPKPPPPAPARLIEIIGDSISAGFGNLGAEQHPGGAADPDGGCPFTTATESAYMTYGEIAGRELGADVSIVALSGWGLYRDNQNSTARVIPSVYANTLGDRAAPPWGFSPQPQVVVINLGTNDFAMGDPGQTQFEGALTSFLATVRSKYAGAWIFVTTGPLLYGSGLTSAMAYIQAVVQMTNAAGDAKVKYLDFGQQNTSNGTGCQYHPNTTEHQAMADKLVKTIHALVGW